MNRRRLAEDVPVAVSACLLGERVRYDGRDKKLPGLQERLAAAGLKPVPVCPEVGSGLPVPRPPVELVRVDGEIRALGVEARRLDVTEKIRAFAHRFLETVPISGFIGKGKSPSCGLAVALHRPEGGTLAERAEGLFVQVLRACRPDLPTLEAEAVADPDRWQEFVEQVRVCSRVTPGGGR